MKTRILLGFLMLAVCLAPAVTEATDCKKIIAKLGPAAYLDECSYDGVDYLWCIDTRVTGNLRGTWHYLSSPADNFWEMTVPDGALGIPSWTLWTVWNLSVFETRKGDIITQDNEILNLDVFNAYGALSGMAFIIGGTDDYEGATGWLGYVITEAEGGELRGEICTP